MVKVGIIGVGKNGETFAEKLLQEGYDIYLLNRTPQRAYGVMEDLIDGYPHCRNRIHVCEKYDEQFMSTDVTFILVKGDYEYSDFKEISDLRTKGLPRDGFLLNNVAKNLMDYKGYVVVVSNPVDLNAKQVMLKANLSPHKVMAYGSNLDTWRGQNELSRRLGIDLSPSSGNREKLTLMYVGEHGDKAFGLWSAAKYDGRLLSELGVSHDAMREIDHYVRRRGVEVILKKYDTTIGTAQPLPSFMKWLFNSNGGGLMALGAYCERNDIYYGQPLRMYAGILSQGLPPNISPSEADNLEAAINKIKDGEKFASGLFVDKQVRNILYIDDEPDTLEPVARAISIFARNDKEFSKTNRVVVYKARTIKESNEILSATIGGIDVLITDHRLTGDEKTGIKYLQEDVIPNHVFTVPVILSGQTNEDDLKSAIGSKFGGYIQKPFNLENPKHWATIRNALLKNEEQIIQ